jgi:2-methylaconitate cis-trans-isomerase PrpF
MNSIKIPATYMRGGTSKGVFFNAADLPPAGAARDALQRFAQDFLQSAL